MSYIISPSMINYVFVNDLIEIQLEEPPNNRKWELDLPRGFQTIKGSYNPNGYTLIRKWVIQPLVPGDFTIYCYYRQLCCGNPIVETRAYRIIVQ